MLRSLLTVLLSATTLLAQSQPGKAKAQTSGSAKPQPAAATKPQTPAAAKPAQPSPAPAADESAQVPANQPVITLHGLCANTTDGMTQPVAGESAKAPCTSTISKAEFEKLVQALPINQALTPVLRRRLAQQYAELLTVAQAAAKAGVDKDPNMAELEKFQHLQNLAQLYIRSLEQQFRNPPQAEIDAYYKEHQAQFEEVTLQRVYVTRSEPGKKPTPAEKSAWDAKAEKVANDVKERAAKGEDMVALQKDGYAKLGITLTPPNVDIGGVRKGALPPETDKAIFALNAGGVYQSTEPSAFVIYKAVSKKTLPVDAVKDEISKTLYQQKMDARKKDVFASVKADLDDKYFGPQPSAMPPGAASPK